MNNSEELKHYGIPGMKWGRRKALPISNLRKRYDRAKEAKQDANDQYDRDFKRSSTLYGAWGPGNERRHAKTYRSAVKATKADDAYRKVKKERNTAIENAAQKVRDKQTKVEKIFFNDGTARKAAQYMVDNNMSLEKAKTKATKEAVRNTSIALAAIGAYALYEYKK